MPEHSYTVRLPITQFILLFRPVSDSVMTLELLTTEFSLRFSDKFRLSHLFLGAFPISWFVEKIQSPQIYYVKNLNTCNCFESEYGHLVVTIMAPFEC